MEQSQQKGAEPLPVRAKEPRGSLGLNRRAILMLTTVTSVVVGISILYAFAPNRLSEAKPASSSAPATPGELIRNLPADYSKIKRQSPILGAPLKGELGPVQVAHDQAKQLSAEEKFLEEQKLQRMKLALAARNADVAFPGVQIEKIRQPRMQTSQTGFDLPPNLAPQVSSTSSRDEDNRQDDKLSFLSSRREDAPYLAQTLRAPLTRYQVMGGTVIPGVLLTGINSDLPGQILGQVSQNIFDSVSGRYLLLPQGTKILGEYDSRVSYGQERVLIVWTRLILPSGKSLSLEGMPGVDLSGFAGLSEKVNNHYVKLISGVVLGSVLGAGAQIARGSNSNIDHTFGQLALEGSAQNINQAGQQITRKNLNIQPTLEISPGQRFNIFVTKDLILDPYNP